ncbi:MAG: hypothetical protein JXO44_11410 [Clostridia bacterium]|nr:hypothetical protein [Clostridia bacterium]
MHTQKKYSHFILLSMVLIYLALQWMTLTIFPYVHSDEAWLSGFSRTVLDQGTFKLSEPFFDLYPRAIHGLRVVFVSLQMLFIRVFGYSITSMRSLSLLVSMTTLGILCVYFYRRSKSPVRALLLLGLLALSSQFLMMSHVARQEPMILLGMVLAYTLTQKKATSANTLLTASLIGICIGVHPNSFLIACGIGLIYLYQVYSKKRTLSSLLLFIVTLALWALAFVGISLIINPDFIHDYLAFGSQLGVVDYHIGRFQGFYYYYYKLWQQIGGTYYLVNIRYDLTAMLLALLLGLGTWIKGHKKENMSPMVSAFLLLVGVNIGLLIIGRYNQTAIIFPITAAWLMLAEWVMTLEPSRHPPWTHSTNRGIAALLIVLLCLQGFNLYKTLDGIHHQDYDAFGERITAVMPPDAKVLGNLNLDYHLNLYQLYDIRNLDYLDEHHLNIGTYIEERHIQYVVLYDEMQYIADSGGKWSMLYGDLNYYEDLCRYLEEHGQLIDTVEAPTYAMRIAKYVDVYPWSAQVYKLK